MNTPAAGMKPSIGRIVHYRPMERVMYHLPVAPAIITRVWSDTVVNLLVFWDTGAAAPETSIQFGDDIHNWSWPERV